MGGSNGSEPDSPASARAAGGRQLRDLVKALRWPAIAAAAGFAVVLGYVGFAQLYRATGEDRDFWDISYRVLQLFTLESGGVTGPVGWPLQVARFLAPIVTALTAITALGVLLREQLRAARLRLTSGHTIICGLGRKGLVIAESLLARGEKVVVIEGDEENDFIARVRSAGATVLVGDATDPILLDRARVGTARRVLSVCGDDGINAEVALRCRAVRAQSGGEPLDCYVHIVDTDLCGLLKEQELRDPDAAVLRLEFFNLFDSAARAIASEFPPFELGGEKTGTGDGSPERPHILVVGCGNLGGTLIAEAGRSWWRSEHGPDARLRVTVVDREATARCDSLRVRWPRLSDACELVPVDLDVTSARFARGEFLEGGSDGHPAVSIAYVCLDDDSRALSAALAIRHVLPAPGAPIVVRMAYATGLASLAAPSHEASDGLVAFGVISRVCDPDCLFAGTHETLARAIHEGYVAEQERRGATPATNASLVGWDDLPDDLKESNRRQADQIVARLAAVGCDVSVSWEWEAEPFAFADGEVEELARLEHERWREERRAAGWRPRPGDKDLRRHTSPSLVGWEELPDETRAANLAAARDLPRLLADVGLRVVRADRRER